MKNNRDIFNKERLVICFFSPEDYSFKLGRVSYSKAHPPIEPHVHEGMLEIVFILKGRQVYTVGGRDYTVNGGEIFVTFPGETHSTADYPEDKSLLYYLIMDPLKLKKDFIGYDSTESEGMIQALNGIKRRVFKGADDLKPLLDRIVTAYYSDSPFKKTMIRNMFSNLILGILQCENTDEVSNHTGMEKVLAYIEQNIWEDISVSMLAEIAGLSEARFKASFRKQIGIPPREFVLRRKIETAGVLLKNSDMSITELAHKLSFSSSQYFHTVFKRFTLMSPNELRKQ